MTDKLNASGLRELFGRAILLKLLQAHRGPRERLNSKHSRRGPNDNPAGTKLVRRFIRRGRGEQTEYRRIYAAMTGHQYGAES